MPKPKTTSAEISEAVLAVSGTVTALVGLARQCRNCDVEPLDNDALKLVKMLAIASRDCADAATALMTHIELSNQVMARVCKAIENEARIP